MGSSRDSIRRFRRARIAGTTVTTDIPTRRRRPLLALVGGALLVFAVLLLLLIIVPIGPPMPDAAAYVFSFAAVALPMGMGTGSCVLARPTSPMDNSVTKVIDNAIIGFCIRKLAEPPATEPPA